MIPEEDITYALFGIEPASFYASKFADSPRPFRPDLQPAIYRRTLGFHKFETLVDELGAMPGAREPGFTVLDFGCGSGRFGAYVKQRFPGCRLVGIDLSAACLAQARANGYDQTICADVTATLPLADGSVDFVFSMDVFGHIEFRHKDAVVRELARVTRAGGGGLHGIEAGDVPYRTCDPRDPADPIRRYVHMEGHIGVETVDALYERFSRCFRVVGAYSWLIKPALEVRNGIVNEQWSAALSHDVRPFLDTNAELVADAVLAHFNQTQLATLRRAFGDILTRARLVELVPAGPMRDYLLELTGWGGFAMITTRSPAEVGLAEQRRTATGSPTTSTQS